MAATTILEDILTGPPEEAAPLLLGMHLVSRVGGVEVRLRLTEVEAYKGSDDPASHAYRGETARNGSMFRKPAPSDCPPPIDRPTIPRSAFTR